MTEQEQIIEDFKAKCERFITEYSQSKSMSSGINTGLESIHVKINELSDEILERHSNIPNIDIKQLKEELDGTSNKIFQLIN